MKFDCFADAFNHHRQKAGLSIPMVALSSGVSKGTLDKLHQNRTQNTSVIDALLISQTFGMTVEEFMGVKPLDQEEFKFGKSGKNSHIKAQQLKSDIARAFERFEK